MDSGEGGGDEAVTEASGVLEVLEVLVLEVSEVLKALESKVSEVVERTASRRGSR